MSEQQNLACTVAVGLVRSATFIYDVVTLPVYTIVQRPWVHWFPKPESRLRNPSDPSSPMLRITDHHDTQIEGFQSVYEMFEHVVEKYSEKECFGSRPLLGVDKEIQSDGKTFTKVRQGDYKWISYKDAGERVDKIANSLLMIGVRSRMKVVIFSETKLDWMLTALGCFKLNGAIVTLYSSMNEEGIVHVISESDSPYLFTSADLLPKVLKNLDKIPNTTKIIYYEGFTTPDLKDVPSSIQVLTFSDFLKLGESYDDSIETEIPERKSEAMIMYTSGTTGVPKGVIYLHDNILRITDCGVNERFPITKDHRYIAYLPLAHIYEFSSELLVLWYGCKVGFSSAYTMTDNSTAIKKGDSGDINLLKPHMLASVPLVLDKIRKGILEKIDSTGGFARAMFNFALSYKSAWFKRGYNTPILDQLIFKKISNSFGGSLRLLSTGGAPLSTDTHDFVRLCLNATILQGYAQTECGGCGTFTAFSDRTLGHVGRPVKNATIKLVDWEEGGYSVYDKPNPRGEIHISGNISTGYFKNKELTEETFYEEDNIRWVKTGDIGEFLPDGNLKIIDRIKDLFKHQNGEYLSLGKIEAELKTSKLLENISVYGDSFKDFLVALIVPNKGQLEKFAKQNNIPEKSYEKLCNDPELVAKFEKSLYKFALQSNKT